MTMKEFLEEGVAYYSKDPVSRRNTTKYGCQYYPLKETSEGCFIGRHMAPENAKKAGDISIEILLINNPLLLPQWMCTFDRGFLESCQLLHDVDIFWTDIGLSEDGIAYVDKIKKEYSL